MGSKWVQERVYRNEIFFLLWDHIKVRQKGHFYTITNHKSLFKNGNNKKSTELLKYVWSLRENNKIASIKWKIILKVYSKATSSFCKLCLTEKLFILNALRDEKCLNKKTEFINKSGLNFCFWIFCQNSIFILLFFLLEKSIWRICAPDDC